MNRLRAVSVGLVLSCSLLVGCWHTDHADLPDRTDSAQSGNAVSSAQSGNAVSSVESASPAQSDSSAQSSRSAPPDTIAPLTVRILDVGQGDATIIENGGTVVVIDGGPSSNGFGRHLDRLRLNRDTIDVVLITHAHLDHYQGLQELFESARRIVIRYVFENRDPSTSTQLFRLRDSIIARAERGELEYRDTDDPCNDGTPICTLFMRGGARLHIMRPDTAGEDPNNRTTAAKLVAADSTAFSMWFGGDAEQDAIRWFTVAGYDVTPGMNVHVLKGNHHGSCNGITRSYLRTLSPEVVTFSLDADNTYGHMHTQTKDLLHSLGIPWYRTDQNGEITFTSPGAAGKGYDVRVERGSANASGPVDRRASQQGCGG